VSRRSLALAGVLAALVLGGCAQNAILELQVQLPEAPPDDGVGPWYAQIQLRRAADHPFDIEWMGGDLEGVELGDTPRWDCVSVQSADPSMDLHVRVRFCRSPDCLNLPHDATPRERWYRLEHPFYIGRRTYWHTTIDSVPVCERDEDCGGVGVCNDSVCGCEVDSECDGEMVCEAGTCVEDVGRCSIEGCIEGPSTNFCSVDTGKHFCETNGYFERPESFECE